MKKVLIILLFTILVLLTSCSLFKDNEPQVQQDTIDYFSQWYTDKKDLTFKEYCQSNSEYSFAVISTEYAVVLNILCNEDGSYKGTYEVKQGNGEESRTIIESYPVVRVTNDTITMLVNEKEKSFSTSALFFKYYNDNDIKVQYAQINDFEPNSQIMNGTYTNSAYFKEVSEGFLSIVQTTGIKESIDKLLLTQKNAGFYIEDISYKTSGKSPYARIWFPEKTTMEEAQIYTSFGNSTAEILINETSGYTAD
ncbi:TPA_asm: hypothetical protein GYZ54_15330 [Listeria monocytogenes]|nr:hypothetical protein [Listeria monocytogenes]